MTNINQQLWLELSQMMLNLGANEVGGADLSSVQAYLQQEYGSQWNNYSKAISFAVYFPTEVVDELLAGPTHTYLRYYDALNTRIDDITMRVSNYLNGQGYLAYPVPASQRMGEARLQGIFSHRLAGRLAGLGWIGKNCCLINPHVGPRLRLGTILTDAPIVVNAPLENKCGSCTVCSEHCPTQAIHGCNFSPEQSLEQRIDITACDQHLTAVRHSFGKRICGVCVAVCPYGRQQQHR